jgi:predicted amidophosphoribosyltransferase
MLASNALEMLDHDLCPRCGLPLQKDRKSGCSWPGKNFRRTAHAGRRKFF